MYIALLRGINVGGKNIVKMAELKKLFENLGFTDVKTYIQSGNVVFDAPPDPAKVTEKIRAGFKSAFGFDSAVILRTRDDVVDIISKLPFSPDELAAAEAANPDVEHLYVYLLDDAPPVEEIARLESGYSGPDKIVAARREIYLLCHQSVRDSKLAASLGTLGVPMTARNWKTVTRLHNIMEAEPKHG